jgi:hypothetical protein
VLVHCRADLSSSTLLRQIAALRTPCLAVFDEFTGRKSRAPQTFTQASNASAEFIGRTRWRGRFPRRVLCRIDPRG